MIGEYLSAIIEDNNTGEYTHYGKLKKLENVEDAGGTIEIDLDKMGGMAEDANKTLYLFNEQCNEDYETDYASDLKEVNVEKNAYAITNTLTKLTTTNKTTYRMMSDKTSPYEAQLTADNGHVLLETITVKVGGKELDAEDYTYKKGKLIIPAEQITGDLEIKAEGAPESYVLSVTEELISFKEGHIGYGEAPAAEAVTLTNKGNAEVTEMKVEPEGTNADAFEVTQPEKTSLTPKEETSFTVQPKEGLGVGSYTARVKITGSKGAETAVNVSFTVSGHTFVWKMDKAATATEKGSKHEECTVCGYEKLAVEIPALKPKEETVALKAPTKINVTPAYDRIKLSWKKVKGATGYQVYRAAKKNGKYKKGKTTKKASWTNKKLKTGKTYYYKIRAYRKQKGKTIYSRFSAKKKAVVRPATPVLRVKASKGKITATWSKVRGATKYQLYRATKKKGKYYKWRQTVKTRYTDRKVRKGKIYYYKARAYRVVKGKRIYSKFSPVKKIRAK